MKLSKASAAVVVIQLLLVGSIAAKYYYQRAICPRVWTRAAMYDPELMMRGRYLSMQLQVDGCQSALPFAVQPRIPGVVGRVGPRNSFAMVGPVYTARIGVKGNQLVAARIPEDGDLSSGEQGSFGAGAILRCDSAARAGCLLHSGKGGESAACPERAGAFSQSDGSTQRPASSNSTGAQG